MYETYIKWVMNPFYEINSPIKSQTFERKSQMYGRKFLTGQSSTLVFAVRVMSSVPEIYKTPDHSPSPTPERAVYGFVVYLLTTAAFLCYILWLIIPNDTLESLGITFLPQKYWAVAVPIYVSVAFFLFVVVIYPSLGMVLYSPDLADSDLRH